VFARKNLLQRLRNLIEFIYCCIAMFNITDQILTLNLSEKINYAICNYFGKIEISLNFHKLLGNLLAMRFSRV